MLLYAKSIFLHHPTQLCCQGQPQRARRYSTRPFRPLGCDATPQTDGFNMFQNGPESVECVFSYEIKLHLMAKRVSFCRCYLQVKMAMEITSKHCGLQFVLANLDPLGQVWQWQEGVHHLFWLVQLLPRCPDQKIWPKMWYRPSIFGTYKISNFLSMTLDAFKTF